MSKIINTELLDQLGRPTEMVDEMLDRQIEALETRLGLRAKGVGNRVLSMFLVNGTRIQLSSSQIQQELRRQVDLDTATTNRIIDELAAAGIIRITSGGRYEIANSFLARRAYQKVEAENRILRTIRATIQDRMSRDEVLDRHYLNYIGSSLPLIDLTEEERAFVDLSRDRVRRNRRRVNMILLFSFVLLAALAANAYRNYRSAQANNEEYLKVNQELNEIREKEQQLLEETRNALDQAEAAQATALTAQQSAEEARQNAENSALEADRQRILADSLRRIAVQDRNRIQAQADRLKELTGQAQRDAQRNLELKDLAEASEKMAQEALRKAETLNLIITSWNAATRALQIEDARTKALVTLEAYKLNRENPGIGEVNHPTIIRALLDASLSFDEKLKFDVSKAHNGAIRDIVLHPNGQYVFTTGNDGVINQWKVDSWNPLGVPDMSRVEKNAASENQAYNLLALSNNGGLLVAAGNSSDLKVFDVPDGPAGTSIPVVPREEIFASGFLPSGDILAAGINHFYRYRYQEGKLEEYPKMPSSKSLIIRDDQGTSIFSIEGRYQDYAYELTIDSLGSEGQTGTQEINFYGTPREVDYGSVAKAGYGRLNDTVALLVIGFTSGRVMFIETDPNGDHFLPRSSDARKDFKPHQAAISDLAFSHDGKKLALASLDGSVSVWDLKHYADPSYQAVIYDRHPAEVLSIAFSRNDDYLLSGCRDGNLYFWNTRPEDYATFLCERLRKTSNEALQQQRKLQSISRKSGLDRAYDELSSEDYRRYFGEGGSRSPDRPIRVCN